jgi:hypothetical protein
LIVAFRPAGKSKGFSCVVIATLAVAIAAKTATR